MTDAKDNVCPECGADLPADAVLCVSCGLHLATGKKIGSEMPPPPAEKAKPQGKKQAKSGDKKKSFLPIIVTAVAVLVLAAGGFLVLRSKSPAKPASSGSQDSQVATDAQLDPEAIATLEDGALRVTGPQFAADAVFTGITSSGLWTIVGPQLNAMSPAQTVTVSIVTPASGTTTAAGTTIATLRAEVRTKTTGAPAFSSDFVGTAPGSAETDPEAPLNAKRAAATEMAAGLPAQLGAAALGMAGNPALVFPQVQQWLAGTDTELQRVACLYLAKSPIRPKMVIPKVVQFLGSSDARLRKDAVNTLTAYGPRVAPYASAITATLQNADDETRDKALALVDSLRLQPSSSGGNELTWLKAPDKKGKKNGKRTDEDDLATLVEGFDEPRAHPAKLHVQGLGKVVQILLYVM